MQNSYLIMNDPLVSRRLLLAPNNLRRLRRNCLKWGFRSIPPDGVAVLLVGWLLPPLSSSVLSGEQISAKTWRFRMTTSSEVSERVFSKTGKMSSTNLTIWKIKSRMKNMDEQGAMDTSCLSLSSLDTQKGEYKTLWHTSFQVRTHAWRSIHLAWT